MFLGFMAATTAAANQHGAAQLARTLLSIGEPGSLIHQSRVPVKGLQKDKYQSQQDTHREATGKDWLLPGPSRWAGTCFGVCAQQLWPCMSVIHLSVLDNLLAYYSKSSMINVMTLNSHVQQPAIEQPAA